MANEVDFTNTMLPPDMASDYAAIQRKRAISQAMLQQSMQPQQIQSWTQGLAQLAHAYLGRKGLDSADAATKTLGQQYQTGQNAAMDQVKAALAPQPAITLPDGQAGPVRPEVPPSRDAVRQALIQAQLSPYPQVQKFGSAQQGFVEKDQEQQNKLDAARTQQQYLLDANKAAADALIAGKKSEMDYASTMPRTPQQIAEEKMQRDIAAQNNKTSLRRAEIGATGGYLGAGGNGTSGTNPLQATIDAIGNGDMPAPTSRSPRNMNLMNEVARQYAGQDANHPAYDATRFQTRQSAEKAFATGKQGDQVRNVSNVVEHAGTMSDLFAGLKNGSIPWSNEVANKFSQLTGQPAPGNAATAAQILGGEITKVIVGNGIGAVEDRNKVAAGLNINASPAMQQGSLDTVQRLLGTQIRDLENQKKATTGSGFRPGFLNATAQRFLDRARAQETPQGTAAPAGALPTGWTVVAH